MPTRPETMAPTARVRPAEPVRDAANDAVDEEAPDVETIEIPRHVSDAARRKADTPASVGDGPEAMDTVETFTALGNLNLSGTASGKKGKKARQKLREENNKRILEMAKAYGEVRAKIIDIGVLLVAVYVAAVFMGLNPDCDSTDCVATYIGADPENYDTSFLTTSCPELLNTCNQKILKRAAANFSYSGRAIYAVAKPLVDACTCIQALPLTTQCTFDWSAIVAFIIGALLVAFQALVNAYETRVIEEKLELDKQPKKPAAEGSAAADHTMSKRLLVVDFLAPAVYFLGVPLWFLYWCRDCSNVSLYGSAQVLLGFSSAALIAFVCVLCYPSVMYHYYKYKQRKQRSLAASAVKSASMKS